ncbi:fimbrial biogenesis chaperone [Rahnella selenatireducens]|uniref:fimbrial biogenesis chaperone n=1 Tax=Rahnella selenatireducens TaxID=3389797 RepID=UPI003968C744
MKNPPELVCFFKQIKNNHMSAKSVNKIIVLFVFYFMMLFAPLVAKAGITLGGTRLVYDENKKANSIDVLNNDSQDYLIQSWPDSGGGAKPDFIITPPLFKIKASSQRTLRVIYHGVGLPPDKESLFWLNVKAIPLTTEEGSSIQVAVKTRIKILFRPKKLKEMPEDEAKNLQWNLVGNKLTVINPTAYYMTFYSVTLHNVKIPGLSMVPPRSDYSVTLNKNDAHGDLVWKVINDYGASTQAFSAKI